MIDDTTPAMEVQNLTDVMVSSSINAGVMFAVPPGLVSGCGGDYSSFICVQPEAVDRVRVKMGLIFYGEGWPQGAVEAAIALFNDTMAEDKNALAKVMRGMASSRHQAPCSRSMTRISSRATARETSAPSW